MLKKNILVFVVMLAVIAVVLSKEKIESFSSDWFHHGNLGAGHRWNNALLAMADAKKKEDYENIPDYVKNYQDYTPKEDGEESAAAFDPNNYVISNYSSQDVIDSSYRTDEVEWRAPELYYEESGNYTDIKKLKKHEEENQAQKLSEAFVEVDTDKLYKSIEMIKLRGGNRTDL